MTNINVSQLLACMQQHMPVPLSLVQTTRHFQTSLIKQQWQKRSVASPGSICVISFRFVNLLAAIRNGEVTDPHVIRREALDIDVDLNAWRATAPPSWGYATIDAPEAAVGTCFDGKAHVYPSLWIADAWSNWRTLRILVNQIVVQIEAHSTVPDSKQKAAALSVIHRLSTDLCISAPSFADSPRKLPSPLTLVSPSK